MNPPLTSQPQSIGQYRIEQTLTPRRTYLAVDGAGRKVVLKRLESDCLLRGKLHPNILDRLRVVRELAHKDVANLYTVERDEEGAMAVWEYLDGAPLDRRAAELSSPAELARLARETALAVESLHALGIVHGAIRGGNVIVDDRGRVRLTHISPLLYDDPAVDAHDLATMIAQAAASRGWSDSPVGRAAAAVADGATLAEFRARLSDSAAAAMTPAGRGTARLRPLTLAAAIAVALAGLIVALVVLHIVQRGAPARPTPPEAPVPGNIP